MTLPYTNLAIIVPVLNYEYIKKTIDSIKKEFLINKDEYKIIIIDDGSNEKFRKNLNEISLIENVHIIYHENNKGKGAAIKTGISKSNCKIILYTDCDLAYPVKEIYRFYKIFLNNNYDILCANRRSKKSKAIISPSDIKYIHSRERAGRIFNFCLRILGLTKLRDTQAGLKVIRYSAYSKLPVIKSNDFLFDVELLYYAQLNNKVVKSESVEYIYHDSNSSLTIYNTGLSMLLRSILLFFTLNKDR